MGLSAPVRCHAACGWCCWRAGSLEAHVERSTSEWSCSSALALHPLCPEGTSWVVGSLPAFSCSRGLPGQSGADGRAAWQPSCEGQQAGMF